MMGAIGGIRRIAEHPKFRSADGTVLMLVAFSNSQLRQSTLASTTRRQQFQCLGNTAATCQSGAPTAKRAGQCSLDVACEAILRLVRLLALCDLVPSTVC